MKIQDLPSRTGLSATEISRKAGKRKQTLQSYTNGSKDKESTFVRAVADALKIGYERLFFFDNFRDSTHDGLDPDDAAYWANLAIEALIQAEIRGLNTPQTIRIKNMILQSLK